MVTSWPRDYAGAHSAADTDNVAEADGAHNADRSHEAHAGPVALPDAGRDDVAEWATRTECAVGAAGKERWPQ